MTLCWASEVVIYACIPDEVPEYATMCVTSLAGTALMLVPFWGRVAAAVRKAGWRFVLTMLGVAALSAAYNYHFIAGLEFFGVVDGAFASCMTVITMPFVMLAMRRRVAPETWLSVALVGVGVVLALVPTFRAEQAPGLFMIGVGSALYALSVVLLADFVRKYDPVAVVVLRKGLMGVYSLALWYAADPRLFAGLPASRTLFAGWAVYAYFAVALAQTLNVFAVRLVPAENATAIGSLKLVFTLVLGIVLPAGLIMRIELSPCVVVGAAFVVAGSLAQILDFGALRGGRNATGSCRGAPSRARRSPAS